MNVKGKQSLSLNNKLTMTLQIQLAIKLLQLNSVDLQKEIDEKILENPFLENENSSESTEVTSEVPLMSSNYSERNNTSDYDAYEQLPSTHQSLREYLMWQIGLSPINQNDQFIAYNIIDYINDDGFLTESIEDLYILLKKNIEITFQEIFAVLHKIQHLDPIGVGATSLKNCLSLQLNHYHKNHDYYSLADIIINKLEDDIKPSTISFDAFTSEFDKEDDKYIAATELVKSLNPKPGNIISKSLQQEHIIPDVIISKKDDKWLTELNPSINPKIRINKTYEGLMKNISKEEDQEYVKTNLQSAKFFLKALQNRNLTILKVAKIIFRKQVNFLNQGDISMKPLGLKDIAAEVDMHESTISRCTNNKYVQTPRGVYEMKHFFSSEINTDYGKMISSTAIKSMLKKIISKEDKNFPLSDSQIADNLKENGIRVARRTIAKYREALEIPPSKKRKIRGI
ncbi:MAG: RNA polymerase factor sigma-54 [Gammaproteobacteria bacterium]|jgi:RNA polymerase sigma-54 factor|nr:RNA polymerase factor sigma-54 [Gammaproteobacteria bacterium]MBT4654660.1 RNA polymerase factor sigma-54 [Gammaproteobacteria bacterium]MBT5761346.1 RNA polymerase factor sigma-54 [Gammaproteobacteria bacterium]MBT6331912.1 RNA polymerase factor sigma-54 [Gammaproteobacteria bacterium]MBT7932989.1 RNA polymerase factor sigma-54 [Gammaproteobacteria bacterium]